MIRTLQAQHARMIELGAQRNTLSELIEAATGLDVHMGRSTYVTTGESVDVVHLRGSVAGKYSYSARVLVSTGEIEHSVTRGTGEIDPKTHRKAAQWRDKVESARADILAYASFALAWEEEHAAWRARSSTTVESVCVEYGDESGQSFETSFPTADEAFRMIDTLSSLSHVTLSEEDRATVKVTEHAVKVHGSFPSGGLWTLAIYPMHSAESHTIPGIDPGMGRRFYVERDGIVWDELGSVGSVDPTVPSNNAWTATDSTGSVLGTTYRTMGAAIRALAHASRTVEARDVEGDLTGTEARRIAADWASPGRLGGVLARYATTGRAAADELLDDIRQCRALAGAAPDLDRLATHVMNSPAVPLTV